MRVVTLEEHYTLPDFVGRVPRAAAVAEGWGPAHAEQVLRMLQIADDGESRLAEMDRAGIDVQVLSVLHPGADALEGQAAIDFSREANDRLADLIARHPDRFGGFARLPMADPDAAARELERACRELQLSGLMVHGMSGGRFLDDPACAPVLAMASALDCPIYLHPGPPPRAVFDAYFGELGEHGHMLATGGWGWHSETALHMLRLVLAGTLDRHPTLRFIIGHMGEGLPAMMGRFDRVFSRAVSEGHLTRTVTQTLLDQLWITTSGFFDLPCFIAALTTFGPDRMLFSVDCPFASMAQGRAFLDKVPLAPADREKLAHQNADRLLALRPATEPA